MAHHPEVLAAEAQRDTARLNLERTVIRAPVSGIVAQRSVQVGQMAAAGHPVMTVVPVQEVYVNANFKEDQLARVRPGQKADLVSDLYGSSVKFHGRVAGLGGGTGAAFAVIPAQNATGNDQGRPTHAGAHQPRPRGTQGASLARRPLDEGDHRRVGIEAMSRGRQAQSRTHGLLLVAIVMVLAMANFLAILDLTIVNVLVPHIAGALAVAPSDGTWVITSYAVAEAIMVPLTGWLAERFGPVRVFVMCIVGFRRRLGAVRAWRRRCRC